MNGPQDLGGLHGFGPVTPEADEPLFHEPWEARVFALTLAMGATGAWNLDGSRAARESLHPVRYLSSSYYQIWYQGLLALLLERGLVHEEELESGRSLKPARPLARKLSAEAVPATLARGSPTERPATAPARFAPGDRVRTVQANPLGHTRLPRYARGRIGEVIDCHGAHVFPDTHAQGLGENPQWLYTVRFDATEIWGSDTSASQVCVDCWESYLQAV